MKLQKLSDQFIKTLKSQKFKYVKLDTVLESEHIIQRSGENFKKLMISFSNYDGKEYCLRPDLTTVSCLRYLKTKKKLREKIFYSGQIYRNSHLDSKLLIDSQIGWEIIGGTKNKRDEDKEIINTSIKCISKIKYPSGNLKIGNIEIFNLLISHLDLPERWKLRLKRHFYQKKYFNDLLLRLSNNSDFDTNIVNTDNKKFLEMKKESQKKVIAGRTLGEILSRYNEKMNDPRKVQKGKKVVKIIKNFLKISCPIDIAEKKLNSFFKKNKINLRVQKSYFPINKRNISKLKVYFSSSLGRELNYYTGTVFEINIGKKKVCSGGRYDSLLRDLGSKSKIQAVGAAINLKAL